MTVDLSKIERTPMGVLCAEAFALSICDSCNAVHIELKGKDGETFAGAAVPIEHLMETAAKFVELHDLLLARAGQKRVTQ